MDLIQFRDGINTIDDQILDLLARRRTLIGQVVELKEREDLQLRDVHREEQLLGRLIANGRKLGLDAHAVTRIFHEIIDDSLRSQQLFLQRHRNPHSPSRLLHVAYQGAEGNFSYLAAQKYFADREDSTTFAGCGTFEEVVEAVEEGVADYGVLPIENTLAGVINEVYDVLLRTKLSIVGEEVFEIHHCLLAVDVVPLSKIRRVLAQWQALAQCSRFLAQLENCQKEPMLDTAMAVRKLREDQDLSQAAIASEEAAHIYGLKVLERNITDQPENLTRFVVLAPKPVAVDPRIPAKTSLIIATAHEAGALLKALVVLERHGINMTKLESRPRKGSRFQYVFYLDFEGNIAEPRVDEALVDLRGATSFLKILGCFPVENRERTVPTIRSLVGERDPAVAAANSSRGAGGAETAPAPANQRHPLASRETKARNTIINVRGTEIGGDELVIMAGPCAVESAEQILACARQVKECGGKILMGGCFKPTITPLGFQGLGYDGLELLVEAGRQYDLPVMTEVPSAADAERIAQWADILLVGHQNMQNFSLLSELGGMQRPVVLRRGLAASLEQLLDAAEFILGRGNQQVMLCEHGISTFETTTRNTLDLGGISILKKLTHLPVIVDPSHAAGQRDLVVPLTLAANAVRPHGIMIEIHPDPDRAICDGPQALRFDSFRDLMATIYT
ncbi:MAG: bifunctional 3-deoxy-7-phosphoheptulonate synthase/chorismate mutase [Pirellulaceae bacterium]|jgi:chorismate mutase/prephenate dehydratase|nr:bifunctional 3-deoxy-7-phosphoheptulonate synthase/chorismate mutase [Pirellulaceae bacterium]